MSFREPFLRSLTGILAIGGVASGQETSRLSVTTSGAEAHGSSAHARISADGRFVVFESDAPDLVPGDANAATDVFVKELVTGAVERVSVSSTGLEGDKASFDAAISPDGRFVVFASDARNLVAGDTRRKTDVFLRDRQSGTTTRASLSDSGLEPDGDCATPVISSDGHYAAFASDARNLVTGDTNLVTDVFVRDFQAGTTLRVSVDSQGIESTRLSGQPAISPDGRFVAFESDGDLLVPNDGNNARDVFLRDLVTATTVCLSAALSGVPGNGTSMYPAFSGDGNAVAFYSSAADLVSFDTNQMSDVFVCQLSTGTIERVSISAAGSQVGGPSYEPQLDLTGNRVVFWSRAEDLVTGDDNGEADVFLRDRVLGTTTRCSVATDGTQGDFDATLPSVSGDGRLVVFATFSNLVADDTNSVSDVFLRVGCEASWHNYGAGHPGTYGIPGLAASAPPRIGSTIALLVDNSIQRWTIGALLAGFATTSVDSGRGGMILVAPLLIIPMALPPHGNTAPLTVPPDDRLCGISAYFQVIEDDPGASRRLSFTPGLTLELGY